MASVASSAIARPSADGGRTPTAGSKSCRTLALNTPPANPSVGDGTAGCPSTVAGVAASAVGEHELAGEGACLCCGSSAEATPGLGLGLGLGLGTATPG